MRPVLLMIYVSDGVCGPLGFLKFVDEKLTYEAIAERLFISVSAVKYRLKNLCKLADASSIKDLLALVKKYYL